MLYLSSICTLWFYPHKKFLTAHNLPPFMMLFCNVWERQTANVHYHSWNVSGILFASSWPPLNSHPLPLKTERGRKDKVHETSRLTYVLHQLLPLSILSFCYASALKLSPINPLELSFFSICFYPPFLPPLLHTTLACSFPFCFRKFSTVLVIFGFFKPMKTNDANPKTFVIHCVLFCIRFVFIGKWDRSFTKKEQFNIES